MRAPTRFLRPRRSERGRGSVSQASIAIPAKATPAAPTGGPAPAAQGNRAGRGADRAADEVRGHVGGGDAAGGLAAEGVDRSLAEHVLALDAEVEDDEAEQDRRHAVA